MRYINSSAQNLIRSYKRFIESQECSNCSEPDNDSNQEELEVVEDESIEKIRKENQSGQIDNPATALGVAIGAKKPVG